MYCSKGGEIGEDGEEKGWRLAAPRAERVDFTRLNSLALGKGSLCSRKTAQARNVHAFGMYILPLDYSRKVCVS